MTDCLFCKIINKVVDSEIVYEDDICFAFKDINPRARVHILIVPRKHISTIADMEEGDEQIIGHLVKVAKEIAEKEKCKSYKLLFNVGREAGQIIFHIHLHLMGN
ncbi:histidine triad nucleotide-binding protein [Patescibacteria group bacterium]|nr:histidine triad nucleotide-binding protein [Patescibacteria group bacterium]